MVEGNNLDQNENKIKNQANELNYLTNEVIPNLKKENNELKQVKTELTEALDESTKKYFDQLDINADLSETYTKAGAELALLKVKYEKLEEENENLKCEIENVQKTDTKPDDSKDAEFEKLKAENEKLTQELKSAENELKEVFDKSIPKIKEENENLKMELKKLENFKKELKDEYAATIVKLEDEISYLKNSITNKQKNYDKLHTELNNKDKEIKNLKKQISNLSEKLKDQQGNGFLSRLMG